VAVRRSGICGTDATEWATGPVMVPLHRRHPASDHLGPMIPGHEFVGEVVDVRAGLPAGTLVAAGAGVWCGQCDRCALGRTNICRAYYTLGLNAPGGLAEYVAVPTRTLRRLPADLSFDAAVMAQPLAVGLHAARRAGVRDGESVVIIGAGAIGTFVLTGLSHLHHADVTVIDLPGAKLERAAKLGANRTLSAQEDVVDRVLENTRGRGADGRVLAVGLPEDKTTVDLFALTLREVTVDSTVAHNCDEDLGPALEILSEGTLGPLLLHSVIRLDDLVDLGLEPLAKGRIDGKVVVSPF